MVKHSSSTSSSTSSLHKTQHVRGIAKRPVVAGSVDSKLAEAAARKAMTPLQRNQAKYEAAMHAHQASLDKHSAVPYSDRAALDESICVAFRSLMTLKECIRNRYLSSLPSHANKHIHIPFRTSKLTLVLREALDPAARVPTRTILIGHLAPSLADSQHSLSTARYVANLKASSMDHAKQATARLGSAMAKRNAFRVDPAKQLDADQLGDPASCTPKVPVHPSKWTYRQLARKFAQWSNNAIVMDKIVPYVEIDHSLEACLERRRRGEKPLLPAWLELQRMTLIEWVEKCKAVGVTELTATKAFDKYQIQLAMGRSQTKAKGEKLGVLVI
ncbi:hypothetical protein BCR44DRAFT_89020 [Catenaria anguillulae PL171]|uniref:Kinesin motor domain-containing protein n=1 Tax=Catenaria anguillulae PL171 TaxID=765915 RepID=A0A1Y2HWQ2_9FUNG|nr:hypothetical protein BCR44DRAFT_89020 [Catenaria anguillulae PL171]